MTYFIEQYRDIRQPDGKVMQTPEPMPMSKFRESLSITRKSATLKTIAVFIIKPKNN